MTAYLWYIPQDFYRAQQQHFAAAFAAAEHRAILGTTL